VTVLSICIGNILMGLASVMQRGSDIAIHWLPLTWVLLLLLLTLDLFWQTLVILEVEKWGFGQFIFIISGPVLLLFATSLMLPDSARATDGDYRAHYFAIASRFFGLMAALMAWMVGVDFVFGDGMAPTTWLNIAEGGLLSVVVMSKQARVHQVVTLLTAAGLVLGALLQGLG
jgi:hypothetical protein